MCDRADHPEEISLARKIERPEEVRALLDQTDPECIVEVTMLDGETSNLEQDGNLIVSAASSVGLYTIPFRNIRSISFT